LSLYESCVDEDSMDIGVDASDDDSSVSTSMIFAFCLCQLNAVLTSQPLFNNEDCWYQWGFIR
jgi:hypothetical protein